MPGVYLFKQIAMFSLIKSTLPTLIFLAFSCLAHGQEKKAAIDSLIQNLYQDGQFNGNVLVVDHGKELSRNAIGYADATRSIPLDTRYRFHIGSIAKEFDAVGLMLLIEQGKLSLDDRLDTFFPDLPAWAHTITVRNLLQYTSGLPEVNYSSVRGDADNWKDLYALPALKFEPGSEYDYNNNNTFLRRQLIEKITGQSIKEFIEEQLVKPAGMRHAVVDPTGDEPLVAKSFDDEFNEDRLIAPISGWTAVTLDDFYHWSQCLNAFKLISPESTQELLAPYEPGNQTGLGSGKIVNGTITEHRHDGMLLHYHAILSYNAQTTGPSFY